MAVKRRHKWDTAIAALISTTTVKAAAEKSGLNYQVLLRWVRSDPEFIAAYKAATKNILDDVKNGLRHLAIPAMEVAEDGLLNQAHTPLERFPIAKWTLETVLNLEISDTVLEKIDGKDSKSEWDCVLPANDSENETE